MRQADDGRTAGSDRRLGTLLISVALGGWWWMTAAANHPTRTFDRVREHRCALRGWLPGWRFFAPNPGVYDYAVVYRVTLSSGAVTPWAELWPTDQRVWWNLIAAPARREAKSAFVVIQALITESHRQPRAALRWTAPYRLLEEHVRRHVLEFGPADATGLQFAVLRHAGYDPDEFMCLLTSAYTSVSRGPHS